MSLLSIWQPIGVVVASAVAYGTTAKWRCPVKQLSCKAVPHGQPCCSVSSNMGWRYELMALGLMTLTIFCLRYFVFSFHESPKFLLSRGREAEAIDVLHKIAKFNNAPPPSLTVEQFFAAVAETSTLASESTVDGEESMAWAFRRVTKQFFRELRRLKTVFKNKLTCFTFVLLAIAYMVSISQTARCKVASFTYET